MSISHSLFSRGLLPILLLTLAPFSQAANLSVGHTAGFDYSTLTAALAAAASGDVITLAEGSYNTLNGETFPIELKTGVHIRRADPSIQPTVRALDTSVFTATSVNSSTLEGIRIYKGRAPEGAGVRASLSRLAFVDCLFEENIGSKSPSIEQSPTGHAVFIQNGYGTFMRCRFVGNGSTVPPGGVLAVWGFGGAVLSHSTFQDNQSPCLLGDPAGRFQMDNCLLTENTVMGGDAVIRLTTLASVEARNCTLANNQGYAVLTLGQAITPRFDNCILWNLLPEINAPKSAVRYSTVRGASGPGVIAAWPKFVDWGSDYRLSDGSPCIGRASGDLIPSAAELDLDGNPRIRGDAPEMGCYEAAAAFVAGATDQAGPRVYVNRNAPEGGDGLQWETALRSIQAGIEKAPPGAEVWIASATYPEEVTPTSDLSLYGGFIGSETAVEQRDWVANPTVIDVTGLGLRCMTVYHSRGVLVDGLTLTGGFPVVENGYLQSRGGAIESSFSGITLRNCILRDNQAIDWGAGVYAAGSDVRFEDSDFLNNRTYGVRNGGSLRNGGSGAFRGLFCNSVEFEGCHFRGNQAGIEGSAILMSHYLPSTLLVSDCVIEENTSDYPGLDTGPVIVEGPSTSTTFLRTSICRNTGSEMSPSRSAVYLNTPPGTLSIADCTIADNRNLGGIYAGAIEMSNSVVARNQGNGIQASGQLSLLNSEISDNSQTGVSARDGAQVVKCLIEGNGHGVSSGMAMGGALSLTGPVTLTRSRIIGNTQFADSPIGIGGTGKLRIENCLIAGNRVIREFSFLRYAVLSLGGDDIEIVNCTLTDNRVADSEEYLTFFSKGGFPSPRIYNSIIWNGTSLFSLISFPVDITYCDLSTPYPGEGNLSEDPLFKHPWDGITYDYHLPCDSPCVDAETSFKAPTSDLDGILRPKGAGIDMGCYENCIYDLDGNHEENLADLIAFPPEWYEPTDRVNAVYDFVTGPGQSNRIDSADLLYLLQAGIRP